MSENHEAQFKGERKWNFPRRTIYSSGVNAIHCCDLMDLTQQPCGGFVFNYMDVYSRYVFSKKMPSKD